MANKKPDNNDIPKSAADNVNQDNQRFIKSILWSHKHGLPLNPNLSKKQDAVEPSKPSQPKPTKLKKP